MLFSGWHLINIAPTYPAANGDQQLAYCLGVINHDGFNGPIQHFDLLRSLFLLVLQDILPTWQHGSIEVQNHNGLTFFKHLFYITVYLWPEETANLFNNVIYPIPQHVVIEGASGFQPDSFSRVIIGQEQPIIWCWNNFEIIKKTPPRKKIPEALFTLCATKYVRNKSDSSLNPKAICLDVENARRWKQLTFTRSNPIHCGHL